MWTSPSRWLLRHPVPLRWHLVGLSVGVLLPVALFAATLARHVATEQQQSQEHELVERARVLASALDREMAAMVRALETLAQSERLDVRDLAGFHAEARRVVAAQPSWRTVRLIAPDGRVLLNTRRAWGDPPGGVVEPESLAVVLAERRPAVGSLAYGDGEWAFPIRVPVLRKGKLRYVLTAVVTPASVAQILGQPAESDWTRTVSDTRGVVVARTRSPERFVGKALSPALRADVTAAEGVAREATLDGTEAYIAYSRAALSGWVVAIAAPAARIEAAARRSLLAVLWLAPAVLLLSAATAFFVARRLSQSIEATAADAVVLARGGRPRAWRSRVAEVTRLRNALSRAFDLLAARERERDEHLARAQAARAEAEEASRAKDEFLAMLGHELRNPLSPIVTALELLKRRGEGGSREHAIVERQVRHLIRLVDDLLDVSRIARGKIALCHQRVELSAIVARAIETTAPLFEQRGHALEVDVPADGLAVDGDPDRLAQVVSNLLTNAARYTPPRGHVRIEATRDDEQVILKVTDDGQGIPPELLSRVFDLFVQAPRTRDRQEGGLGLGLTLVRSLVEAHGGRVEARSDGAGKGSVFVVTLPGAAAAAPAALTSARHDPSRAAHATRVLLVDDNVDAAQLLGALLSGAGHEVLTVHDGPAALDALERFAPAVAVLDIGLPVMDGYELAGRIRERLGADAPVLVALTGYGQRIDRERTGAAGFARHFVKPADPDALLAAIEALTAPEAPAAAGQRG